jgi:aldehyde reductase
LIDNISYGFFLKASSSGIAKTIKLRDGHSMPLLGYGSFTIDNRTLIKDVIMAGYRLIDTAYHYQNEKELGAAIKELIDEGKIKREDLFITTKVWNTFHSRSKVLEGAKLSQRNLGLDYIDLLLIHWPIGLAEGQGMLPKDKNGNIIFSQVDYVETWAGMEDVYEAGIAKSIGVSNFNHKQIERVLAMAKIKPVINQV